MMDAIPTEAHIVVWVSLVGLILAAYLILSAQITKAHTRISNGHTRLHGNEIESKNFKSLLEDMGEKMDTGFDKMDRKIDELRNLIYKQLK